MTGCRQAAATQGMPSGLSCGHAEVTSAGLAAVHNQVGRLWNAGEPLWDADSY
jgi:hypothetical protein